ncbi:heterokaryon incompatibility protein-domain-containing protein [Pyrenochaeta sp. MPI-SDFR-AT-0127]|nr:heterokaryon incompatibility protein-domain-containing protein [Pyrenochaeta sp. MPI-SDFR-AT-0127]
MLHYMGTRQPPRQYPVYEEPSTAPAATDPCNTCLTRVWTPKLYLTLSNTSPEDEAASCSYIVTSHELRESVQQGCKFCRTIADGIHGRVFLDELYERWNKTDSYPESLVSAGKEGATREGHASLEDNASDQAEAGAEDDWNGASAFNEEMEEDATGGWETWQDRDTLTEVCKFQIKLSFERGEGELFTFMNAYVEADAADTNEPNELQKLCGEKAVELRYHINIDDNQAEDAPHLFPPRTSNSILGSETNMSIIERWMQKLPSLPNVSNISALQAPARLIDVQNHHELRIVETSSLQRSDQNFAALSYVWGTNQTFVLLNTTKDLLATGFHVEQLPRTIQDAVTVTRRVGLRYLWVDALCIMQDSNEDKARELPKMRLIYKCAAVTVVAAVAKSATEGFLHHMQDQIAYLIKPVSIPYRVQDSSDAQTNVILSYPADYKRSKDPINDRAWTFQELLLSTRAILFSYRGVQTIDRINIPSADGMTSGKDPQLPSLPWSGQMFSLATNPENARQIWLATRGEYSRRNLSFQGDKLLAIAAVAEELGQKYKSKYLAGMWERDLAMDIQWSCPRDQNISEGDFIRRPRAEVCVAPSWSWASVDASVEDFVHVWEEEGEKGGEGIKDSLGFEVISCEVELVDPDFEYGAVKSGILVVKGRLCSFIWRPHEDDDFHKAFESDGFLARAAETDIQDCTELKYGEATIDALDPELQDDVEVVCLATRLIENVPGRDDVEGLMLLPVNEEKYRRVGFFKINSPIVFEKCEVEKISIV